MYFSERPTVAERIQELRAASLAAQLRAERLIVQFQALVHWAIKTKFQIAPNYYLYDELVSAGNVALCNAARTFDPLRGTTFKTYAATCVIRGIASAITKEDKRGLTRIPANTKIMMTYVHEIKLEEDESFGTEDEQPPSYDPELIQRALKVLPDSHRKIIELVYLQGLSLDEAGQRVGLTRQRVNHIQSKALKRLRKEMIQELRSCRTCASQFSPATSLQWYCGYTCSKLAERKRDLQASYERQMTRTQDGLDLKSKIGMTSITDATVKRGK